MDCVGYGVMSFWTAFTLASDRSWKMRLAWLAGGLVLLWLINVIRIGLFLVAINKGWPMPFGLDHHTLFNIFAYGAIALMIWRFEARRPQLAD
jgi:exosortase/archaeosortase family protein